MIALAVTLSSGPETGQSPTEARVTASTGRSSHDRGGSASGPVSEADEAPPPRPVPECWEGLARLEQPLTIKEFRAAAGPLLASAPPDPLLARYLQERLAELIGSDEGRGLEVLEAARRASPAERSLLLGGLSASESVQRSRVAERLTQLALDEKAGPEQREELLLALQTQRSLPPQAIDGIARLAMDENGGESAVLAARTLGRVMEEDFNRTGSAGAYLSPLMRLASNAPEEGVRRMALEMPMVADIPSDPKGIAQLTKLLQTDASESVRELAASNLALSEDKKKALEALAASFEKESERCVRWAIFRYAARAAGKDALPVMQNMAVQDPIFQESYRMFEKIYASGVVDFERVWLLLENQDPYGCLHKDGDES